ncbi:hypothetical protein M8J75_005735 [Diaphorina citri]|nr:hypothetical protein M8J75_005735 [Diaphorina citri]
MTPSELDTMKQLGNREYLLSSEEKCAVLLSLVNILYAYCYDVRTTMGEHTVESGWTVNKLSSALCWLQSFTSLKQVLISSMRRSLCYPLYREWRLSCAIQQDVNTILSQGKRSILKCLLSIHSIFNSSEPRYILNQLYIQDYCIWILQVSDKRIRKLAEAFKEVTISKSDLGFDLDELETAARIVEEEEVERALCNHGGTAARIVEEEEVERALCNHVSTLVLCSNSEQSESSSNESESDEESSSSSDDKTLARSHSKIILDSDDTEDSE